MSYVLKRNRFCCASKKLNGVKNNPRSTLHAGYYSKNKKELNHGILVNRKVTE